MGTAAAGSSTPRFNGARSIDRDERKPDRRPVRADRGASMGPGRLTGMNAGVGGSNRKIAEQLQWGPVD